MAQVLLTRTVDERGVDARVSSAGVLFDGQPATPTAVDVMAGRGLDLTAHRSRIVTPEMVGSADLVVTMAREHVREVVIRRPDRYGRVFTLKELVRRGDEHGPRRPDEALGAWLGRVAEGRRPAAHEGASPVDDVADPIGQGAEVYERTAADLDALTTRLADLLWGADLPPGPTSGPEPSRA